jgi:hypothetical protein
MLKSRDTGRSAFSLLFQSPLVFSVLCPLSFAATGLFLGMLRDPNQVRLWHLLMAFQPALWLASVLVLFNDFRSHRPDWPVRRIERKVVVLCTLLAGFMGSFPFLIQILTQRWIMPVGLDALLQLPHSSARLILMGVLSVAVATLNTAGMLSVHVQLLAYPREPNAPAGVPEAAGLDEEVLRYHRLRARLERCLVFSAVIIAMTTLSLGAFRELLHELDPAQPFAPSHVLSYGVYNTGLLASVYLPTRKTLADVGEALAARFVRQSPAVGTSWKDWSQEQEAVRTWLGLRSTALQDLQQALSVLAPLLASVSSLALGAGG